MPKPDAPVVGHAALFTKAGDTPAYAGVLHQDGSVSEVRVETNENDDFVLTIDSAPDRVVTINRGDTRADT